MDISTNLTTYLLSNLTGGDYYLGTWPRASCSVDTRSRGKILAQIHIPSVEAPINVPVQPPVDDTPFYAPIESPVRSPAESPIQVPVADKEPTDLMPVVIVLSIVLGVLVIVAIVLLYKLKRKQPQFYDTIQ